MTPSETVTAFIEAIERLDVDAAITMLAEDVSYENVPMRPITGREGVRAVLDNFLGAASEVSWPVSSQITHGNRVVNERVDRFKIGHVARTARRWLLRCRPTRADHAVARLFRSRYLHRPDVGPATLGARAPCAHALPCNHTRVSKACIPVTLSVT